MKSQDCTGISFKVEFLLHALSNVFLGRGLQVDFTFFFFDCLSFSLILIY